MEEKLSIKAQGPEAVANAVALLMSDPERNAQRPIFSKQGRHKEVDRMLLKTMLQFSEYGEGDGPRGDSSMSQKEFMATMQTLSQQS